MTSWFSSTSPFDAEIEKATHDKNTTEPWDVIMTVCDKIKSTGLAKEGLKAITKRLGNNDPHVIVQAITLLDSCVINCGKSFHLEVASREFETEFKRLLAKHEPPISTKLKLILKKWAEGDFKDDPQLDLIPTLYKKLKSEGHDFIDHTPQKTPVVFSKDPNVVSSQQEEEDIAKAIELSLKETKGSPKTQTQSTNLYPSFSMNSSISSTTSASEPRKVRALYDFEAAEDNELTFVAGEIIHVVDDSDQNWWKGYSKKGEGLFPSNFVTADLSVEPESMRTDLNKTKKSVQFSDEQKEEVQNQIQSEIDEEKIDRLFHLLSEANPEDPSQDTEEMLVLEHQVNQMGPLIDSELERVDRKHAQLTQLSSELVDAINLYHTLMRESDRPINNLAYMGYVPQQPGMYGMYQAMPNMFLPPTSAAGGVNYGPQSMPQQGMISQQPPMSAPHHIPSNSMPPYSVLGGQQLPPPPPGIIPQQLQNGHMGMMNSQQLPQQNNFQPSQGQQQQQQIAQSQTNSNIVHPGQSQQTSAPLQNLPPHIQQNQHIIQTHPTNSMPGHNFMPTEQQQQQINMVGQQNLHMSQQQRTTVPNHQIPMQLQHQSQPQQQQTQMMPQSHIIHQISGASPVHLPSPHLNTTTMHYGGIQTSILPSTDSKSNIPIYQQQR